LISFSQKLVEFHVLSKKLIYEILVKPLSLSNVLATSNFYIII